MEYGMSEPSAYSGLDMEQAEILENAVMAFQEGEVTAVQLESLLASLGLDGGINEAYDYLQNH